MSVNLFALGEFVITANEKSVKKGPLTLFLYIISVNISNKILFEEFIQNIVGIKLYSNYYTNKILFEEFIEMPNSGASTGLQTRLQNSLQGVNFKDFEKKFF